MERATEAPMSRARHTSDRAPRISPGRSRTSGSRPRGGSAGRGRGAGMSIGSRRPAARVSARSPSARAWWNLNSTAKEPPSSPGSTWASHGGRPRSSGRSMSRPATAWKSAVGACSRTWSQGVEVRVGFAGGAAEGERPAQGRGQRLPHVADAHPQSGDAGGAGGEQVRRVGARGGRVGREDPERARGASGARRTRCSRTPGREERAGQQSRACLAWTTGGSAVNRPQPITVKYDQATYS